MEVQFADNDAIDDATVDETDLALSGPSTPSATTFVYDAATDLATWTYSAPAAGWDDGAYSATIAADSVSDLAAQGIAETTKSISIDIIGNEIMRMFQAEIFTIIDSDGDSQVRDINNPEDNPSGTGKENGLWIGHTGIGYLDLGGDAGDGASFEITANAADQAAELTFRYANGGGSNRPMDIFVNDNLQGQVTFPTTDEWFNWEDILITIELEAGLNTIRFNQTGGAGPNIDKVTLTSDALPPDQPPAFDVAPADVSVHENVTGIIADYDATDPDGNLVTYSLEGTDAADFAIDLVTGELSFVAAPDFEAPADDDGDNVYNVTVKATAVDLFDEQAVTITVENLPSIASGSVEDGDTDVDPDVSLTYSVDLLPSAADPNILSGVDESSIIANDTVKLIETDTGTVIPVTANGSGGNDVIAITPLQQLDENTDYTLIIDGVTDLDGRPFETYQAMFETGLDDDTGGNPLDPQFIVDDQATIENVPVTSLELSPDGAHLYAASIVGSLYRWDVDPASGALTNQTTYDGLSGRAVIGIAFDPNAPDELWLTSNLPVGDAPDFTGELVRLTLGGGPGFDGTLETMATGFPRSTSDHLTNSIEFDANGDLYVIQGSNSASGAADGVWGNRDERLLSAAALKVDHDAVAQYVASNGQPYDVQTDVQDFDPGQSGEQATPAAQRNADGSVPGHYNPFAAGALVTIHATGARNAYDGVWHSNGNLYIPTNGTGTAGNVPDDPATAFDESTVNTGNPKPDFLFKASAQGGEYFGHPNPTRGEYIHSGGNPTAGQDVQEITAYPEGTQPDENFVPAAFDFGNSKSPNGSDEFTSDVFNGGLKNALLTTRFSGGDDIITFEFDQNGDVVSQDFIRDTNGDVIKFENPLDLVTDGDSGRIYVIQYNRGQPFASSIKLLTPDAPPVTGPEIEVSNPAGIPSDARVAFNSVATVVNGTQVADILNEGAVQIDNFGTEDLDVTSLAVSGPFELIDAAQASGFTVAPNSSVSVELRYVPSADQQVQTGSLTINSNDADEAVTAVTLAGYNQQQLESGQEPSITEILEVFGYQTDIGDLENSNGDSPPTGSEVESAYWEAADGGQPVTVTQIAAFTGPRDYEISWFGEDPNATQGADLTLNSLFAHAPTDSHTLLPTMLDDPNGNTDSEQLASASFTPAGSFGLAIEWNNNTDYTDRAFNTTDKNAPGPDQLLRFFPLVDGGGNAVPNTYLLMQDYQSINFDWNDNVYIVSNIAPAGTAPDAAPTATIVMTPPATENGDLTVEVQFADDNAIDDSTVDQGDLALSGPSTESASTFAYEAATDIGTWTFTAPAGGWADGTYTATIAADSVADDAAQGVAETVDTIVLDLTPPEPGDVVWAVNVAGPEYTALLDGTLYAADPGPSSGSKTDRDKRADGIDVTGTQDDDLYTTYAFGDNTNFGYATPIANGDYIVTVELAESFFEATGERQFNILFEGDLLPEYTNIDIFAESGGTWAAYTLSETVTVADGELNLDFQVGAANNPTVSAFKVEVAPAADPVIAIADASATEGGDNGDTTLPFALTATQALAGAIDLGFKLDGVDQTATVNFASGVATLEVLVSEDDIANGDDVLEVTELTVISPANVTVDPAADTATGTVFEDDFAPVGTDDTAAALQGQAATLLGADLVAKDADGDNLTSELAIVDAGVNGVGGATDQGGTVAVVNGDIVYTPAAGFAGDDTFLYTVQDPGGNSATAQVSVAVLEPGALITAVNLAGPDYTAQDGTLYSADPGPSTGTTMLRDKTSEDPPIDVLGTEDDDLYLTYAFGDETNFGYNFMAPIQGDYEVTLELTEPFQEQADLREFNVLFEGVLLPEYTNIDIFEASGGMWVAYTLTETVTVNDGELNLDFQVGAANNPILSAFKVTLAETEVPTVSIGVGSSTTEGDPADFSLFLGPEFTNGFDQPITVRVQLQQAAGSPETVATLGLGGDVAFNQAGDTTIDVTIPANTPSPFGGPLILFEDSDVEQFEVFDLQIIAANVGTTIDPNATPVPFDPALAQGGILDDDNSAPVADADGPYTIVLGEDVTLDASGSSDPDTAFGDTIVSYQWDLDDDGAFDDATGVGPTIDAATLSALGLDVGTHTIRLQATDSFGINDTDDTTLTIEAPNTAPVVQDVSSAATEDGSPVIGSFDGDDVDPDDDPSTLTYAITSTVSEGNVVNNLDGTFTFDPGLAFQDLAENETRDVSFDYTATDSHDAVSNPGKVTVTVTGTNDTPVAAVSANPNPAAPNQNVTLDASASSDADSTDTLMYAWDLDGDGLFDDATGAIHETSFAAAGAFEVAVQVADETGAANEAGITVQVDAAAGPPNAEDEFALTGQSKGVVIDVLANDTDGDGSPFVGVPEITLQPTNGAAVVLTDGRIVYAADSGFENAFDSFDYEIADGGGSDTATVDVFVQPIGNPAAFSLTVGNDTSEVLLGTALNNEIRAAGGDDVVLGGSVGESLLAGTGSDIVIGGGGSDNIFAGVDGDKDLFILSDATTSDRINEFDVGDGDALVLVLSDLVNTAGLVDAGRLELVSNPLSGGSVLSADLDGNGSFEANLATLVGVSGVDVEDVVENLLV